MWTNSSVEFGSDIGAADFQCTLDAIMNTPGSLSTAGYDQITSVAEGASAKEVVVEFATKYALPIEKAIAFAAARGWDRTPSLAYSYMLAGWTAFHAITEPVTAHTGSRLNIDEAWPPLWLIWAKIGVRWRWTASVMRR
mgnify:CR=1 FL=1